MKRLIFAVLAALALSSMTGCMYSTAVWNPKTNKMYMTKNGPMGIGRAVLECTPAGEAYNCQPMPDAP